MWLIPNSMATVSGVDYSWQGIRSGKKDSWSDAIFLPVWNVSGVSETKIYDATHAELAFGPHLAWDALYRAAQSHDVPVK
jgi:hypothetical protein